jgi:hypothetical protein
VQAATTIMCQGDVSGASTGSRAIGGTNSAVPSQTLYVLNSAGCAVIKQADIGYFLSQGYTFLNGLAPIIFTTGVQTGTTDIVIGNIPPNAYISEIVLSNSTANAVTGGVSFGTAANGTQILATLACAANCVSGTGNVTGPAFSTTAQTPIHAAAVTAWNSANVTITVIFGSF